MLRWSNFLTVGQAIAEIDAAVVIDRCFRYLQMLITTTLIAVLCRSVLRPNAASWIEQILCLSAGIYLCLPASRWYLEILTKNEFYAARLRRRRAAVFLVTIAFTLFISIYTHVIILLVANSIHIDDKGARAAYQDWRLGLAESSCVHEGQSQSESDKCIERVRKVYGAAPLKP